MPDQIIVSAPAWLDEIVIQTNLETSSDVSSVEQQKQQRQREALSAMAAARKARK